MTRLIDADELKHHKFVGSVIANGAYQLGWNDCIDAIIDNAPMIEDRPQGKWKIYKTPVNRYYQCSCCGKNSPDFTVYMEMNYCPNCGADMREAYDE